MKQISLLCPVKQQFIERRNAPDGLQFSFLTQRYALGYYLSSFQDLKENLILANYPERVKY